MSINAAKSCKVKYSVDFCDSRSYKAVRLDVQLRTTSKRKKQFLELIGTSETTDITIDINDHLKKSTVIASDDIRDNGELKKFIMLNTCFFILFLKKKINMYVLYFFR